MSIKKLTRGLMAYGRVFLSAVFLMYLNEGQDLFSIDIAMLKKFVNAGIAALVPVIYNALNPKDERYGLSRKTKLADKDAEKYHL